MRKSRQLQFADTGIFYRFFKGHNGEHIFATDGKKTKYLQCLCEAKNKSDIKEHVLFFSFCIMSNHPHQPGATRWVDTIKYYPSPEGAHHTSRRNALG